MDESGVGLRARTRRAVRGELLDVARELFLEHGLDATTVDQIAAAAGLSRRSFFRYFTSKDDVLAQILAANCEEIAATLAGRPAAERPWMALRRAFDPMIAEMSTDDRALPMTRLLLGSPSLQAGHSQKVTSWRRSIADALTQRSTGERSEHDVRLRADALSGAALACLMSAQSAWVASEGHLPLGDLVDVAMAAVSPIEP